MAKEMKLGENGGMKQAVNGGIGEGGESTRKQKNRPLLRGLGVELLERLRLHETRKKMTEVPSLHPPPFRFPLPSSPFNPSMAFPTIDASGVVHFRPPPPAVASSPTPGMLFYGIGRGSGMFRGSSSDHAAIGSGHGGFRSENSKELSSIPNHVKCASDGGAICHKKNRMDLRRLFSKM